MITFELRICSMLAPRRTASSVLNNAWPASFRAWYSGEAMYGRVVLFRPLVSQPASKTAITQKNRVIFMKPLFHASEQCAIVFFSAGTVATGTPVRRADIPVDIPWLRIG